MKKQLNVFLFALTFILIACGPTKNQAKEFMDQVVRDQKEVMKLEGNLVQNVVNLNLEESKSDLKVYQENLSKYLDKYTNMEAFDKDDELRLAMIELCTVLKEMADINYLEAINYLAEMETPTPPHQQSLLVLFDILGFIDLKSDEANDKFLEAQKIFIEKYNL